MYEWVKYLIIICVFYVSAVLQKSFFTHFNPNGAFLNLVFCFFILLIFFDKNKNFYRISFYSLLAGFFLDIYSSLPIGFSVLVLLATGLLIKKTQFELIEKDEAHPFFYFILMFLFSFIFYTFCLDVFLYFFSGRHIFTNISLKFAIELLYNLLFALIIFILYKNFFLTKENSKQMPL